MIPSIEEWVKGICEAINACEAQIPCPCLLCEPDAHLLAQPVSPPTIGSSKSFQKFATYVAIDGGMSDNPARSLPVDLSSPSGNKMSAPLTTVTIAGKHCESGDILIKEHLPPQTKPGIFS